MMVNFSQNYNSIIEPRMSLCFSGSSEQPFSCLDRLAEVFCHVGFTGGIEHRDFCTPAGLLHKSHVQ